ncbi:MAG TPA: tetratricopeptide repeat protein [Bryobacteraceae bacterium]|jgi:tetratricopeptide (TPR) repeat protein
METRILRSLLVLLPISCAAWSAQVPDEATSQNNLGSRLYSAGQFRQAEAPLARAIDLWSKEPGAGEESPDLEIALHNLAAVYRSEGRLSEAIPLYERAIHLRESRAGATDLGLLLPLDGLALLYLDLHELRESKSVSDRALSIAHLHRDEQTAEAAAAFSAMGSILAAQARYSEARSWIGRALSVRERLFGPESLECAGAWMDLALVYRRERRLDDAARAYDQALKIYRETEGASGMAAAMSGLAGLQIARHRSAEAGDLYEQALMILQMSRSSDDSEVGQVKAELAGVRVAQKRMAEAVKLYRGALGVLEAAWGAENPRLLPFLELYAKALRAQEDYAEAAGVDFQSMKIRVKQTLGKSPA